jgi:uncharacterized protein (UPF0333 family)
MKRFNLGRGLILIFFIISIFVLMAGCTKKAAASSSAFTQEQYNEAVKKLDGKLNMIFSNNDLNKRQTQAIVDTYKKELGINVSLEPLSFSER